MCADRSTDNKKSHVFTCHLSPVTCHLSPVYKPSRHQLSHYAEYCRLVHQNRTLKPRKKLKPKTFCFTGYSADRTLKPKKSKPNRFLKFSKTSLLHRLQCRPFPMQLLKRGVLVFQFQQYVFDKKSQALSAPVANGGDNKTTKKRTQRLED